MAYDENRRLYWRALVVSVIFLLALGFILWRIIALTLLENEFLQRQGNARTLRSVSIPAYRGLISDRQGHTLAISTPVYSVWANPKILQTEDQLLLELASILEMDIGIILDKLQQSAKEFVYLKRSITPYTANKIRKLKLPGCYLDEQFKRYYPEGLVTAHIVGFNDIDDSGQEGIELQYNNKLAGSPGLRRVHQNPLGQTIAELSILKQPKPGEDVKLSIDLRIQFIAHTALQEAMQEHELQSASIVVLDATNGEVLAMANQPTYNPNDKSTKDIAAFRNRAITDVFEPGSVMKPFLVAAALESQIFKADDVIDTSPGWMSINGHTIRDFRDYGAITIGEVLRKSSNVGIVRMLAKLPNDSYTNLLQQVGIGDFSYIDFPGEPVGTILSQTSFNHTSAVLAMGYSVTMTTLQLARAFSIFCGTGELLPVSMTSHNKMQAQQVISADNSRKVLHLLEQVTKNGTARKAAIPGYRIAAKTGTARIATPKGYDKNRHVASVVGIGPVSEPKLIVAIVLQDPTGDYYGGKIAAPVLKKVLMESFQVLNIAKDDVS